MRAPKMPVRERLIRPIVDFTTAEASSGILLLICTALALVISNSPWAGSYFQLLEETVTIGFGDYVSRLSLLHWINDGLMAIFFFLVGMEIKRELIVGELNSVRKAALPVAAALGGMLVPALIYVLVAGGSAPKGWGIPMATDIAFALGVLALLGPRVPLSLKIFLAALAIVDDLGAVLVIAVFYSSGVSWAALGWAGVVLVILLVINRLEVRNPLPYVLFGVVLWALFLSSGVHATIAGVLLAFTIPARVHLNAREFLFQSREALDAFEGSCEPADHMLLNEEMQSAVHELERKCEAVQMPLERIENVLQPWVAYLIVPIFAFANAGVALGNGFGVAIGSPMFYGIVLGLAIGKPIGITLFTFLAVRLGIADLPNRVGMRQILGAGVLGGIGFTMSLFIASLAFGSGNELAIAKVAILVASALAGVVGYCLLRLRG